MSPPPELDGTAGLPGAFLWHSQRWLHATRPRLCFFAALLVIATGAAQEPLSLRVNADGSLDLPAGAELVRNEIHTLAGVDECCDLGDGSPTIQAWFADPSGMALDPSGNVYIADSLINRIRRIEARTGVITTVAGTGEQGFGGDGGPATEAQLARPRWLAVDARGNIYVTDDGEWGDLGTVGHRVRRIDAATGVITTFAGTGAPGFDGDGGPATEAMLNAPAGIEVDSVGNVFVADSGNVRLRMIDAVTGVITTLAGTGAYSRAEAGPGPGDGGPAIEASFNYLRGVAVDLQGNVHLTTDGYRVRRIDAETRIISTLAGTGELGFDGDGGPAASARLHDPAGIAGGPAGDVYFTTTGRIRVARAALMVKIPLGSSGEGINPGVSSDGGLTWPDGLPVLAGERVTASNGDEYEFRTATGIGRVEAV